MIKPILKKILKNIKNKKNKSNSKFVSKLLGGKKIRLLDIGAAGGIQEIWLPYKRNIDLILFEPHLKSYEILKKENYKVINKGLGAEKNLKQKFFQTKKPECSSLLEPNHEYLKKFPNFGRFEVVKEEEIETTTIDDEFTPENYPHFIKIDTEGAELPILKGGKSTLNKVFGLVVECYFFELHKNQNQFDDVKKFLESKNIEFIDFLSMIKWERHRHSFSGQPQVSDILFLVSPEQITDRFRSKDINLDTLKIYIAILFVFNRSDLIKALIKILTSEEKLNLHLEEAFLLTEKNVKKFNFSEKIIRLYRNYFL